MNSFTGRMQPLDGGDNFSHDVVFWPAFFQVRLSTAMDVVFK
jgi:hypothetical protein